MMMIDWDKFPHLAKDESARRWLQFTANIGRAPNTVLAYGRAVEDHLRFCGKVGVEPLTARADVVAAWIGDMHQRPNPRSAKLIHLDSGSGLSNATIQQLFVAYLRQRRQIAGRAGGRLLLSVSRRNHGTPLGVSSWSKIVTGIGRRAGVPRLATHAFRHLRLTDLARADWTIDQIAQYAGHRDLSTTLRYIHLSGRELAAKLRRATASVQVERERLLATLVGAP